MGTYLQGEIGQLPLLEKIQTILRTVPNPVKKIQTIWGQIFWVRNTFLWGKFLEVFNYYPLKTIQWASPKKSLFCFLKFLVF